MVKYILHGGNSSEINSDNDSFFREMTLGLNGKVKILLNYFSREEHELDELATQDKQKFIKNSENQDLEFEIAVLQNFTAQLKQAKVIWIRGGDTDRLIEKMSQIKGLEQLFREKVIAGSSAGVYLLSKYYRTNNTGKIGDGLGILNLKTHCHYKPEDMEIVKQLLNYKEDLPLLVLPNHKWVVIYK